MYIERSQEDLMDFMNTMAFHRIQTVKFGFYFVDRKIQYKLEWRFVQDNDWKGEAFIGDSIGEVVILARNSMKKWIKNNVRVPNAYKVQSPKTSYKIRVGGPAPQDSEETDSI